MKTYPFMQVDAFTTTALGGNPCAVFFDTADMSDETMLAVTREMNLSESAFVRPSTVADFAVRYFTPMSEIPLAGHPTIATTYALVDLGRLPLTQERTIIQLELTIGPIEVEIYAPELRVQFITMTQKKPQFLRQYTPQEVLPIFGLIEDDLVKGVPIQTVSTGTPQLMVAVKDLSILKKSTLIHEPTKPYMKPVIGTQPIYFVPRGSPPAVKPLRGTSVHRRIFLKIHSPALPPAEWPPFYIIMD